MSLKSSISDFFKFEELRDNLIKLVEAKFELKKLEMMGKVEKLAAKVVMKLLLGLFVFMIFLLLNIFIAVVINHFTQTYWIGFTSVIIFYLLLFLIFNYNKPKVSKIIEAKIADAMVKEEL